MPKVRVMIDFIPEDFAGGAASATNQILDHLKSCQNIELINEPRIRSRLIRAIDKLVSSTFFLELAPRRLHRITTYERRVQSNLPDIVCYLNPTNNAKLLSNSTFFTTIWDLGHIELSWLSEYKRQRWGQEKENQMRSNLYRAKVIFADSEETAMKTSQTYGIPQSRFVVIPFVPREEFFRKEHLKIFGREEYAIYPSNFWEHKNHVTLFRAMRQLLNSGKKPVNLVLTGYNTGFEQNVKQLIELFQLQEFVQLKQFVSLETLIDLYLGAKLTVYPSLLGPTNIPPLESVSLGTPVYASTQSLSSIGSSEIEGVKLLPAKDVSEWAKVLDKDFVTATFEARRNQEIFAQTKLDNFQKIQSVIFDECRDLLQ